MHRGHRVEGEDGETYCAKLMKSYKECRSEWMDFQLAGSAALPFLARSSRMHLAAANKLVMNFHDKFREAMKQPDDNGLREAAEELKQSWIPEMAKEMADIFLMIQKESVRKPRLRCHTKEIIAELEKEDTARKPGS